MIIQHNIMALNSYNKLSNNNSSVQKNLEKLSSGYRINRAGDDAAGLAISEKMRAQITGLERAKLNAQDGISLVQTAEGALTEVHSILNRLVELGTESANGIYQSDDRQKIQDEVSQSLEEIDRISQATNFNGINLLDGSLGGSKGAFSKTATSGNSFKTTDATQGKYSTGAIITNAGANGIDANITAAGDTVSLTVNFMLNGKQNHTTVSYTHTGGTPSAADVQKNLVEQLKSSPLATYFNISGDGTAALDLTSKTAGLQGPKITGIDYTFTRPVGNGGAGSTISDKTALTASTAGTDAFTTVSVGQGTIKANSSESAVKDAIFEVNGRKFAIAENSAAADMLAKQYKDVSFVISSGTPADDHAALASLIQKETGFVAQASGADGIKVFATGTAASGASGLTLQIGDTADEYNKVTVSVDDMSASGLGLTGLQVTEQGIAADSITQVKSAIEKVSTNRGKLGALQNRMEHTINNLSVTTENMTAAESRVRDTDMAKEMMAFTKNNVLVQAAQSMLAQANQQPQQVLQLLR